MAHHDDALSIDSEFSRVLSNVGVGVANIFKRSRPGSTLVTNASILDVERYESGFGERAAKMPSVSQIVVVAPVAAMDVHHRAQWFHRRRQAHVDKMLFRCAVTN